MASQLFSRKSRLGRLAILGCAVPIMWYAPARAATIVSGFTTNSLPANDDGSTSQVGLGFSINFYGGTYSQVYVNNNGNITFDSPKYNYTPTSIALNSTRILSAFLSDVDTRGTGSGLMQYGTGTYNGHNAFGATWTNVGYFSSHADKLDTFQIIIEELPATSSGDFAVHYIYQDMQWDTADTHSDQSAMVGISDGVAYNQQVPGSQAIPGGSLTNNGANALIRINGTGIQTYTILNNVWIGTSGQVWQVAQPGWTRGVWTDSVTPATFDGRGIATVNIVGDVSPMGVVVSAANGAKDYTLTGSGRIVGNGWLTKRDNTTLTLLNDNTFTGGTFLIGGTIQVGDGVTDGHLPGNVSMMNNTKLVFKPGAVETFSGTISGDGYVVKDGPGTLVFTGAANQKYSGGDPTIKDVLIKQGTLQLGDGITNPTIAGSMVNNGVLAFDPAGAVNYSSVISGTGSVVKLGSGSLVLSGTNTFTGGTTVNGGILEVRGSIGDAVTNPGGTLTGGGTITGNLTNRGRTAPGSSSGYGTLSVGGNFVNASTGVVLPRVAAAGYSDCLHISGTATINGGTVVPQVQVGQGAYSVGQRYRFLQADGGITGGFASVWQPMLEQFSLTYDASNAYVQVAKIRAYEGFGSTVSQKAVGVALDQVLLQYAIDHPTLGWYDAPAWALMLDNSSFSQAQEFFDELSPARLEDVTQTQLAAGDGFMSVVAKQARYLNEPQPYKPVRKNRAPEASAAPNDAVPQYLSVESSGNSVQNARTVDGKTALWASGISDWSSHGSTDNMPEETRYLGGVVVGGDYHIADSLALGASLSYTQATIDWENSFGNATSDSALGSVYLLAASNGFWGDAIAGYGYSWNKSNREIAALGETAEGDYTGQTLMARVDGGYDFKPKKSTWVFGPTARFQVMGLQEESFTESGANGLDLNVDTHHTNSMKSGLGGRVGNSFDTGGTRLVPYASVEWVHEYVNTTPSISSSFVSATGSGFEVQADRPTIDSFVFGLGVDGQVSDRWTVYLQYSLTAPLDGSANVSNTIYGGVKFQF